MFKCCDCGLVFDEPKNYSEDRTPGGVFEGGSFIYHWEGCPSCSGTYDEAMLCQRCEDEYISIESSYPFCDECVSYLTNEFATLIRNNFREDEYDVILDRLDYIEPYKKGE